MSEELIKRLRKWAKSDLGLIVMYEAADTIEAQAAEIAEYRRQHCSAVEIARPLLDALEAKAAEIKRLRRVVIDVAASLAAAISLLERGGKAAKKAAPSDLMFDQMVRDYTASLEDARAALGETQ